MSRRLSPADYRSNYSRFEQVNRYRQRSRSPGARYFDKSYSQYRDDRYSNYRNMAAESRKDCRVYVGNLSYDVKWHQLKDFMRKVGNVVYADVLMLPNGMSKGCGIVQYSTPEEARYAVEEMNDLELLGRRVYVREDRETGSRNPYQGRSVGATTNVQGRQLFVNNLSYSVSWQDLKDLFKPFGKVQRSDILLTPDGRHKGCGIILFEVKADAEKAINDLNGIEFQGRLIEIHEDRKPAGMFRSTNRPGSGYGYGSQSRQSLRNPPNGRKYARGRSNSIDFAEPNGDPSDTIFVDNLPWVTTSEDLIELFSTVESGCKVKAEIQLESNGRKRGSGVVTMESVDLAHKAIEKFDEYEYGGRPLRISFVSYRNDSQPVHDTMDITGERAESEDMMDTPQN